MNIEIVRSKRRTVSLELKDEGTLLVRAPYRVPRAEIDAFVREKESWILRQVERRWAQRSAPDAYLDPLTKESLAALKKSASAYIPERVAYFAPIVGVDYGRIAIRAQKTCFGSCSAKGNLNFNVVLMRMPPAILDYVVVHELCHRKYLSHAPEFWREVRRVLPDYEERRAWLSENGRFYIEALPS